VPKKAQEEKGGKGNVPPCPWGPRRTYITAGLYFREGREKRGEGGKGRALNRYEGEKKKKGKRKRMTLIPGVLRRNDVSNREKEKKGGWALSPREKGRGRKRRFTNAEAELLPDYGTSAGP